MGRSGVFQIWSKFNPWSFYDFLYKVRLCFEILGSKEAQNIPKTVFNAWKFSFFLHEVTTAFFGPMGWKRGFSGIIKNQCIKLSFFCIKYSSIKAWYWLVWFFGKNLFSLFSYCWVKKGPKWSFSSFVKNQWIELLHFLQEVITALRLKINPNELFSENSCTGFFEQKEAQSECFKVL